MNQLFNKLGLAITFSPTGNALLKETKRLQELFNAKLALIHVGLRNKQTESLLNEAIFNAGINDKETEVIWTKGDPAMAIIKSSKSSKVDLLIAGALEKEKFLKFYIGSVARRLMRSAESSVLIFKSPSSTPKSFKNFFVSTDFSAESERTVRIAYQFAKLENANELVIIRDFHIPALASMVQDLVSVEELESIREKLQKEEEEKMKFFINELNLKGIKIKTECIYGKEGWEASNYARENHADIFAVNAPSRKYKFLDRIFPHEAEYSFENLPSNLLIIR